MCLISNGKEFHTVFATKVNDRFTNVFVRSRGVHRILLSEECTFIFGV